MWEGAVWDLLGFNNWWLSRAHSQNQLDINTCIGASISFFRRISAKIASYTDRQQLDKIHNFLQRWKKNLFLKKKFSFQGEPWSGQPLFCIWPSDSHFSNLLTLNLNSSFQMTLNLNKSSCRKNLNLKSGSHKIVFFIGPRCPWSNLWIRLSHSLSYYWKDTRLTVYIWQPFEARII